jgi:hypothetical protein
MKTDLTAGLELLHTKLMQRRKPVLMPTVCTMVQKGSILAAIFEVFWLDEGPLGKHQGLNLSTFYCPSLQVLLLSILESNIWVDYIQQICDHFNCFSRRILKAL